MNNKFQGPQEDEFRVAMEKAFKAMENRRRRKRALDNNDEEVLPPPRRRRYEDLAVDNRMYNDIILEGDLLDDMEEI